jgi:hypothetical protein
MFSRKVSIICVVLLSITCSICSMIPTADKGSESEAYGSNGTDLRSFLESVSKINKLRNEIMVDLNSLNIAHGKSKASLKEQLILIKIKNDYNILNANLEYYIPSTDTDPEIKLETKASTPIKNQM